MLFFLPALLLCIPGILAWKDQCGSFAPAIANVHLLNATYYEANVFVNLSSPLQTITTSSLPAFCRLQLNITTNPATGKAAYSEVWLPDGWNSRTLGFGNGGWSGGGHNGISRDGSFGGPRNDDAIIDFAYRALHLTTVAAKTLASQYYGYNHTKSYYMACSTGGRQGIKAMSSFPEDYDGVVIGSPANAMARLQPWTIHQSLNVQPVNSSRWIPAALWPVIHKEALRQCDSLDGVTDGIISNPEVCDFRPELITCRKGSNTTTIWMATNWIFSGYVPGGELGYPTGLATAEPYQISTDYYKYFVLNDTTWDYHTLNASTNTPDLTAFFARGGKVIQYVGWNDQLISPGNSIKWYKDVYAYTLANSAINPDEHFKLFTVPGMRHCFTGEGAWIFGAASQRSTAPPPENNSTYDIQVAMVEWLETNRTVDHIVATKYRNDSALSGVSFTRKLCPVRDDEDLQRFGC
ncbi:hypothetical protein QFC21_006499 [Naganishia friedmannii]|uniref:Uncharacterized protein n=1 Tax=Naganishia friedmannii TaxID=89922 RepID=A0ACC2V3I7_9TREE|nr:hypothetical protein QFC21_006499 [Naganishia friedmannii]